LFGDAASSTGAHLPFFFGHVHRRAAAAPRPRALETGLDHVSVYRRLLCAEHGENAGPAIPWGVNRHDLGVRSTRAQEPAMSLAGETSIDGKPTRFRTFQVCPKDLPVLLRQFACAAWAGDSGCSASRGP